MTYLGLAVIFLMCFASGFGCGIVVQRDSHRRLLKWSEEKNARQKRSGRRGFEIM